MTTGQIRGLAGDRLAQRWARLYTRRLDAEVAQERRDEIASDVHEQVTASAAAGRSRAATSRALAARTLLGIPADLSWRRHHLRELHRAEKENAMAHHNSELAGRLASTAGFLVVGWIVLISVVSAIRSSQNDWPTRWISVALVVGLLGIAVAGLVRLLRGHAEGAYLLAVAALGSTVFFLWVPLIPLVGLVVAGSLFAYGVNARKPPAEQVAG
jgi:hypothetical protein